MPIFNGESLNSVMRAIASALQYPVIIILMLILAASIVLAGTLIVEIFTERRHLKVKMPELVDALRKGDKSTRECIAESGLLKSQKKALTELINHPELTPEMLDALATRIIEEEQGKFESRVIITDLLAKLGPIFGLLGTLIPLGPGIIALGQGNTYTLSQSLLSAFDTTIVGLVSAAIAMIISMVRKKWYANYMSILEALVECILEVESNEEKTL